jgi:hypothetical protein
MPLIGNLLPCCAIRFARGDVGVDDGVHLFFLFHWCAWLGRDAGEDDVGAGFLRVAYCDGWEEDTAGVDMQLVRSRY